MYNLFPYLTLGIAIAWSSVIPSFCLHGMAKRQEDFIIGKAGRRPCKGLNFSRRNIPGGLLFFFFHFSFFQLLYCWQKLGENREQACWIREQTSCDANLQLGLILSNHNQEDTELNKQARTSLLLSIQNSKDSSLGTTNDQGVEELGVCRSSPQICSDCSLQTALLSTTNTKNSHADGTLPAKRYQHSASVHS